MTVDREIIATRVAKIREEMRHLARLGALARDEFLASSLEQHAAERELQIVIESCLDIGVTTLSPAKASAGPATTGTCLQCCGRQESSNPSSVAGSRKWRALSTASCTGTATALFANRGARA